MQNSASFKGLNTIQTILRFPSYSTTTNRSKQYTDMFKVQKILKDELMNNSNISTKVMMEITNDMKKMAEMRMIHVQITPETMLEFTNVIAKHVKMTPKITKKFTNDVMEITEKSIQQQKHNREVRNNDLKNTIKITLFLGFLVVIAEEYYSLIKK